jgi:quercetin dioxygenase-like cupin family protein
MNVGERIRELRQQKGFSLRKVAEKSNLSSSLISQIETAKVDPSLSTMRKIAVALDVPLFYLVLDNHTRPSLMVKKSERRKVVFPKAGLEYEIIHSDLLKKMGIMIGTLAKGGATSEETMNHPGEECLIILEGVMRVQVGDQTIELQAGDSFYFDSSIPHRLYNEQDRECKFYLIITPPKF